MTKQKQRITFIIFFQLTLFYVQFVLHIMVSKKYPNAKTIMNQFNDGLRQFKQQPEYTSILKRFGLK